MRICNLVLLVLLPSITALADNGNGVDNGGEKLALEVTMRAREIYELISNLPEEQMVLTNSELERFRVALEQTRVDAVKGPIIDNSGREVDARTYFDDSKQRYVIDVDEVKWTDYLATDTDVFRLIFHEYLRTVDVDDDNYKVSSRLEIDVIADHLQNHKPYINPQNHKTIYEQLQDYYKLASLPNWESDVKGVTAGLCYFLEFSPNAGRRHKIETKELSNGSLFPFAKKMAILFLDQQLPEFWWDKFSDVVVKNKSLVSDMNWLTFALRKYGKKYLIAKGYKKPQIEPWGDFMCYFERP